MDTTPQRPTTASIGVDQPEAAEKPDDTTTVTEATANPVPMDVGEPKTGDKPQPGPNQV